MEKFIIIDGEKMNTEFEYDIGETIRYNSVYICQCIRKDKHKGELLQYFSKGRVVFDRIGNNARGG